MQYSVLTLYWRSVIYDRAAFLSWNSSSCTGIGSGSGTGNGSSSDYRSTIRGSVNPLTLTLNPNPNPDPRVIGPSDYRYITVAVSYTHLTLPTKRIV